MSQYIWNPPTLKNGPQVKQIARQSNLPLVLAPLLYQRGYHNSNDIDKFLHPNLSDLGDPFKMHDMKKGTERIKKAIHNFERITIYGDYDTDGITSTSIMYDTLKSLGANVHYFIPNRFKDGYGPNLDEYKQIIAHGTTLMITVDNGIAGYKQVKYAEDHHCDVIITDHHDFPKQLPPAYAIIMAKFPGHEYSPDAKGRSKEDFCGAGIAFKISQALLGHIPERELDLAALGTVADIVKLTSEDRILVTAGLKRIREMLRPGVHALIESADIHHPQFIDESSLGFTLIPRLNALGRLGDANLGVQLMTTHDYPKAKKLAAKAEKINRKRQRLSDKVSQEAIQLANQPNNLKRKTLVLIGQGWHEGVVGIAASRVLDKFYKPTLVLNYNPKTKLIKGSGRSIPEYNMSTALMPNKPNMVSFGGHPMACGMTIKPSQVQKLKDVMEKSAQDQHVTATSPQASIDTVVPYSVLTIKFYKLLRRLAPFGPGNEEPLFEVRPNLIKYAKVMGKKNDCVSMTTYGQENSLRIVAFKVGAKRASQLVHLINEYPDSVDIIGHLSLNRYKGKTSLQMIAVDFKFRKHENDLNSNSKGIIRMPSKSMFAVLYRTLAKKPSWPMTPAFVKNIAAHFSISLANVKFMLNVFYELRFLGIHNGTIVMNQNPKRQSLTNSKLYRKVAQQRPNV